MWAEHPNPWKCWSPPCQIPGGIVLQGFWGLCALLWASAAQSCWVPRLAMSCAEWKPWDWEWNRNQGMFLVGWGAGWGLTFTQLPAGLVLGWLVQSHLCLSVLGMSVSQLLCLLAIHVLLGRLMSHPIPAPWPMSQETMQEADAHYFLIIITLLPSINNVSFFPFQNQAPVCFLFSFSCCYSNGLSQLHSHQKSWLDEVAMKHLKI